MKNTRLMGVAVLLMALPCFASESERDRVRCFLKDAAAANAPIEIASEHNDTHILLSLPQGWQDGKCSGAVVRDKFIFGAFIEVLKQRKVVDLDLSHSHLEVTPFFADLTDLQKLTVSGCPWMGEALCRYSAGLRRYPRRYASYKFLPPSVKCLDMSSCNISCLSAHALPKDLHHLDIRYNRKLGLCGIEGEWPTVGLSVNAYGTQIGCRLPEGIVHLEGENVIKQV